jgi:hypothetical protein
MKKIILCMSLVLSLGSCTSEFKIVSSDVPQAANSAFQQKYPAAQNVEWEAEKADGHLVFEAEFMMDGKKKEAYFKPDGTFLKEE